METKIMEDHANKQRCWNESCVHAQLLVMPNSLQPPGTVVIQTSVHGIFKARILEWVPISSCRGSSQPRIEHASPALAGGFFTTEPPGKPHQAEGEAGKFSFYLGSSEPMFFSNCVFKYL